MKETLVVIPYLAQEAQGCELQLAVEGWRQHFKNPHLIVIVGDWDDQVSRIMTGRHGASVFFMDCPRVGPREGQYLPHLDHVNKFLNVSVAFPDTEGFIYTCDDIYAVKDFTLEDVLEPKVACLEVPPIDWKKEKAWWRDLGKTRECAAKMGWPVANWVLHLPVYYKWDVLLWLNDKFDMRHNSYVMENLYFNYLTKRDCLALPPQVPRNGSKWKHEIATFSPDIRSAEEAGSIWIMNHNSGWSAALESILRKHYGLS